MLVPFEPMFVRPNIRKVQRKKLFLHATEHILGDGRSIFMEDIHQWISTVCQIPHAETIVEDDKTIPVPQSVK